MLVTRNVVTKEEVVGAIKELEAKLGRSPRYPELIRVVNVTRRQIARMFGRVGGRTGRVGLRAREGRRERADDA